MVSTDVGRKIEGSVVHVLAFSAVLFPYKADDDDDDNDDDDDGDDDGDDDNDDVDNDDDEDALDEQAIDMFILHYSNWEIGPDISLYNWEIGPDVSLYRRQWLPLSVHLLYADIGVEI